MKRSAFYAWKLLAAFWFIYLVNLGFPTYGQSVINACMAKSLHLDRTMLGLAFSLYMLMVGLPGPAVAVLVNRMGVRKTPLMGSCSGRSHRRTAGNRASVYPQTRARVVAHVQWRWNRRVHSAANS